MSKVNLFCSIVCQFFAFSFLFVFLSFIFAVVKSFESNGKVFWEIRDYIDLDIFLPKNFKKVMNCFNFPNVFNSS